MSTETSSNVASAEHNRTVALRWIDAFNARDDAAEAAARTADYIAHAPESIQPAALDSDAWVGFLGVFVEGFPDLHLEVQDSSADEGMVAQRILFTGTHSGPFRGLPPTGRTVRFSGLEINRMVDGQVAEHWFQLDTLTLFEQLGLLVVPGPRLLPRLLASPITRLVGKRRRTIPPREGCR
ncbi:MAG TPA: ester cyclase [Baekduia sp.]|nr:ester cyclase [Baekduia sp.]